jgi:hypothetical protein
MPAINPTYKYRGLKSAFVLSNLATRYSVDENQGWYMVPVSSLITLQTMSLSHCVMHPGTFDRPVGCRVVLDQLPNLLSTRRSSAHFGPRSGYEENKKPYGYPRGRIAWSFRCSCGQVIPERRSGVSRGGAPCGDRMPQILETDVRPFDGIARRIERGADR